LNLCTSHILVFGCLHDQDVVGSFKKVAEKLPGTKITWYYLRRTFIGSAVAGGSLPKSAQKLLITSFVYFG